MATACPTCNNMIDIDFGMAQCSQCQAVFYVNLDGSTSISEEAAPASLELEGMSAVTEQENPSLENSVVSEMDEANNSGEAWGSFDLESDSGSQSNDSSPVNPEEPWGEQAWEGQEEGIPEEALEDKEEPAWQSESSVHQSDPEVVEPSEDWISEDPQHDESLKNQDDDWDIAASNTNDVASSWEEEPVAEPQGIEELRENVVSFGNSEVSSAKSGVLLYCLFVSGLDTKEDRKILREVLEDRKLLLSTEEVFRTLREGTVKIENLNPIKAAVIVSSLYNSGLEVSWRQIGILE